MIILAVSFAGELMRLLIPVSVPAGIYGMVLMLLGLMTKVIPLEKVKKTGNLLTGWMSLMFVPATVGIMNEWGMLTTMLPALLIAVLPVTWLVMGVSGRTTQRILQGKTEKGRKKK